MGLILTIPMAQHHLIDNKNGPAEFTHELTTTLCKIPLGIEDQIQSNVTYFQSGTKSALSRHQVELIENIKNESTLIDLMRIIGRKDRTKFKQQMVDPLIKEGYIEMTIPDKPKSRLQKYHIIAKGLDNNSST